MQKELTADKWPQGPGQVLQVSQIKVLIKALPGTSLG